MPNTSPQQLLLDVQLRSNARLDSFICHPDNQALLKLLHNFFQPCDEQRSIATQARHVYLHGHAKTGKTHLLQGVCHLAQQHNQSSFYLPLRDMIDMPAAELLTGLESQAVICIDDLELIAANPAWEQALFHLYNRAQHSHSKLFFAAKTVPDSLGVQLDDLVSRLKWGLTFRLAPLQEAGLRQLLQAQLQARGIRLDETLLDYIMQRTRRDAQAIIDLVDTLDRATLENRRALSKPFIKQTLGW